MCLYVNCGCESVDGARSSDDGLDTESKEQAKMDKDYPKSIHITTQHEFCFLACRRVSNNHNQTCPFYEPGCRTSCSGH